MASADDLSVSGSSLTDEPSLTVSPVVDASGPWTVSVARTLEEVERLRPSWEALQADSLRADPDFFLTVLRSSGPAVLRPHVILFERDGRPEMLVVARIESIRLPSRFGYRTFYAPRVRSLTVVYGGVLGATELAAPVVDELWSTLAAGEADVVYMPSVRTDSPIYELARNRPPALCRQRGSGPKRHWRLVLPGSLEEFLVTRSARSRGRIRRYPKRLLDEYGDRMELRTYRDSSSIDELFAEAESVAAKTYQRALGASFEDSKLHRAITQLAMDRGWFRGYVLRLDGVPRAFWFGIGHRGVFRTGQTGFDPDYRDYNVGTYVLMRMIEDLCAEPSINVIDYGFGEAEYKHTFGSDSWEEDDVLMFAPTFRAVRINGSRAVVNGCARACGRVLARTGMAGTIKSRWRRRLQRSTTTTEATPAVGGVAPDDD